MMGSASQMKIQAVLVFILISAVAGKKQRFPEESLQQYRDSYTVCSGTSAFDVSYDYTGVPNDSILSLDAAKGLAVVECDIDNSSLNLKFATQLDSAAFAAALLKAPFKTFVTSRFKYPGCPTTDLSLVRRVMTVWPDEEDNVNLLVGIADAKYDELIKDGTISIMPKGPCTLPHNSSAAVGVDQKICIGLNVKDDCSDAAAPIPMYTNKIVSLTCQDCYFGFGADVFINITLQNWRLVHLAGGFLNMSARASLILDLKAEQDWSVGYDQTFPIIPQNAIIDVNVGPLPFRVTFQVPLRITADATFHVLAELTAGANAQWNFGDMYVVYTNGQGWTHVTPSPSFSWSPYLAAVSPEFTGTVSFGVIPGLQFQVNNVFTYQLTATPALDIALEGSWAAKEICSNTTAQVVLLAHSELKIDIDFLHIHEDKVWDKTIYDSGVLHLE